MKYAREVIELMAAYPGREWRMANLVRYVDPRTAGNDRQKIRNRVLRVLATLSENGQILSIPPEVSGSYAVYRWVGRAKSVTSAPAVAPAEVP